jgi:hypothetical protein
MNRSTNDRFEREYNRLVLAGALIMGTIFSGCAGNDARTLSEVVDQEAHPEEIAITQPIDIRSGKNFARRTVGVAQAGILYTRSFHVDPINRPVSNLLSLSSFALKSAGGLVHRSASEPSFSVPESQPIPELSYAGHGSR